MIWPFQAATVGIRPLAVGDAAQVAAIHAEGFARGWPLSDIERMLVDPAIIGDAAIPGRWPGGLRGFALSRVAADEAEILSIAVRRKDRGRGLAGRLLAHHMARLAQAGARAVFLEVEEMNAAAIALYRRYGFETIGQRRSYYRNPDGSSANALAMRRILT